MEDYSEFMSSPFGYITHYEIVDNEIHVYTSKIGKRKPQICPLTKENVDAIEKRLETQYKILIDNSIVFKEKHVESRRKIIFGIVGTLACLLVFGGFGLFLTKAMLGAFWGGLIASIGLLGVGALILNKVGENFDSKISSIKEYYDNRKNIETISEKDKNITNYLSDKTKEKIEDNEKLKTNGIIDDVFNINLLDNMSKDDLVELLNRYNTACDLGKEQEFVKPSVKTRKRTKNGK